MPSCDALMATAQSQSRRRSSPFDIDIATWGILPKADLTQLLSV
jgi:hypothetical protein